jgi:hypothetical protein
MSTIQDINNKIENLNNQLKVMRVELNQADNEEQRKVIKSKILITQNLITIENLRLKVQRQRDMNS